jgi:8-oxo-dGTP pyrophosphatase MutT (NUDIX family)
MPDHTPRPTYRQPPPLIRPLALALLLWRDHVLCAEGVDMVKGETFYRALGGGIEFGERAADAVVRELLEETGRVVEVRAALGAVENLFTFNGGEGHEVIFEFVCTFAPGAEPTNLDPITADESGSAFTARWLPLAEVVAGTHRVYPDGLPDRLAAWLNTL